MGASKALLAVVGAHLVLNLVGLVISVAGRMPAEFGGVGDPDKVLGEFFTRGTLLAAPLAPLVALVAFTVFAWRGGRWLAMLGFLGLAVIGILFVIGNLGEPLEPEASDPHIAFLIVWRAISIGLSGALAGLSARGLYDRLRSRRVA